MPRWIGWGTDPPHGTRFAFISLLMLGLIFFPMAPAMAALDGDLERGEQIFSSNCAACHMGGGNVIRANRALKITDLNAHVEEYPTGPSGSS